MSFIIGSYPQNCSSTSHMSRRVEQRPRRTKLSMVGLIRQSAWEAKRAKPPLHPRTRLNSVPTMVRGFQGGMDYCVKPANTPKILLVLRDDLAIPQRLVTIVGTLFIRVRGPSRVCTFMHLFFHRMPILAHNHHRGVHSSAPRGWAGGYKALPHPCSMASRMFNLGYA
jgi:hypothetical protein